MKRIQKHALYNCITTDFCRCNKSLVLSNSETENCWESYYSLSHNASMFDQCRRACNSNMPILFSLPRMKIWGMAIELDPKGDIIACLAFGLHSSPAEYSTTGHCLGFDES